MSCPSTQLRCPALQTRQSSLQNGRTDTSAPGACAEVLHVTPQFKMAPAVGRVQRHCAWHWDLESAKQLRTWHLPPPPLSRSLKSNQPGVLSFQDSLDCRAWALTSSFFNQRMLSFASEPNSVSIAHQTGAFLEPNWKLSNNTGTTGWVSVGRGDLLHSYFSHYTQKLTQYVS